MAISFEARKQIDLRVDYLASRDDLIMDGDTHASDLTRLPEAIAAQRQATPNYFHGRPISAEELVAEMDLAGVDVALSWQNPAATVYGDDAQANFEALHAANAYIYEAAKRFPTRIVPAGWTDPKALGEDRARRLIDCCIDDFGFAIVKMNPAQNAFPIDSEPVLACVDHIVGRGAIPAFHYGADTPFTPPEGFAAVARRHSETPVIGVHMGGGGAGYVEGEHHYQASRRMLRDLPNVFFIESAKRDTHIESDLIDAATDPKHAWRRIAAASDAPYGRMTWNFGGYRLMMASLTAGAKHTDPRLRHQPDLISEDMVAGYLGGNLRRLLLDAHGRLIEAN